MAVIREPIEQPNVDEKALKVFLKTLDIVGGPRKLFEYRNLTWLPSLMEASFVAVLQKMGKTSKEIAQELGLSTATVRAIMGASEEKVMERITEGKWDTKAKTHIAGGLAKLALKEVEKEAAQG